MLLVAAKPTVIPNALGFFFQSAPLLQPSQVAAGGLVALLWWVVAYSERSSWAARIPVLGEAVPLGQGQALLAQARRERT
jgi:hypothetical protein